jgi:hypothetical protein
MIPMICFRNSSKDCDSSIFYYYFLPMGTFFYTGDIRGQTYSPKGLFLEGHSTVLGTNACSFVPVGTIFCAGDIRGQKLVPEGTIPRGTFDCIRG